MVQFIWYLPPNRASLSRPSQELDPCALGVTTWWVLFNIKRQLWRNAGYKNWWFFVSGSVPYRSTWCIPAQTLLGEPHTHLQRRWHAAQSIPILRPLHLWLWLQRSLGRHLCESEWSFVLEQMIKISKRIYAGGLNAVTEHKLCRVLNL